MLRGVGCVLCVVLCSCGSEDAEELPPIDPPERTAAQDAALRALLVDLAHTQLCDHLEGQLLPLPAQDAPTGPAAGAAPATGRFWIERCEASRADRLLTVRLEGLGWTYANEQRQGPLGSQFAVRGHLRFRLSVSLTGHMDVAYSQDDRVVTIWLTPERTPQARVEPLGQLPVTAEGTWSGLIGALGSVMGDNVVNRARPIVIARANAQIANRLRRGFTVTMDLCTGQRDVIVGALSAGQVPQRPFSNVPMHWIANQRVEIHRGGIDVAGFWESQNRPMAFEVEVEEGPGLEARVVTESQGTSVLNAFVTGRPATSDGALSRTTVESGSRERIRYVPGRDEQNAVALVLTPLPGEAVQARFLVRWDDASSEGLMDCGD